MSARLRIAALAGAIALLAMALAGPAQARMSFVTEWGGQGTAPGKFGTGIHDRGGDKIFDSPGGVAVDGRGVVWVSDPSNNRVQAFNVRGRYLGSFGPIRGGIAHGKLNNPEGLAVDRRGNVYVADNRNDRLEKFNSRGRYVRTMGWWRGHPIGIPRGSERRQFVSPWGLAVSPRFGVLYAVDQGNARIQLFTAAGAWRGMFGSDGFGPGRFLLPYDVAVDQTGYVYVTDAATSLIHKFTPRGRVVAVFGGPGSAPGEFFGPTGIAVDRNGNLVVADRNNRRVQRLRPDGTPIDAYQYRGVGRGRLSTPTFVATDHYGNIFVSDYRKVVRLR